jgi:hypothetical protein
MPEQQTSPRADTAELNASVPRLPTLRTRALKPTRDYWEALHEDGLYQRFTAVDRFHVRLLLDSINECHRAETARERVRWLDLVRAYERDLGLQSTPPPPPKKTRRDLRRQGRAAEDELAALA